MSFGPVQEITTDTMVVLGNYAAAPIRTGTGSVLCSSLAVQRQLPLTEVAVVPNPANASVGFSVRGRRICSLVLETVSGACIYTANHLSTDNSMVDVQRLPAGVYFYTIITEHAETLRGKLVVAH